MALCCMVHTSLQLSMILVLHLSTTANFSTQPQGPQGQEDHLKLLDSSSEHHLCSRRQATWQGNLARLIGTVVTIIAVAIAGK